MKKYSSQRVFKSPFWESMTHVDPLCPLLAWTPWVIFFLWRALFWQGQSVWQLMGLGLFGVLVWTLVEYLLHRFAFHYQARGEWGRRIIFLAHGLHHDDPKDKTRLVMPPLPAAFYIALFYALFWILLGDYVDGFFAFFLIGYLAYDYIHYGTHHFHPRTKVGQFLKQHHLLHHYRCGDKKFGVSSPLWDWVFGSYHNSSRPDLSVPKKNSRKPQSLVT